MRKQLYIILIYILCSTIILCSCKCQYVDKCFGCYVCLPECNDSIPENWETDKELGVYLHYEDNTCSIAKGPIPSRRVDMDELVIPEKFAGIYTVIEIQEYAFYEYRVKSIRLPKTIMRIGKKAFYNCRNLETIYFEGTIEQWFYIDKDPTWDEKSRSFTVECVDGTIPKGWA